MANSSHACKMWRKHCVLLRKNIKEDFSFPKCLFPQEVLLEGGRKKQLQSYLHQNGGGNRKGISMQVTI